MKRAFAVLHVAAAVAILVCSIPAWADFRGEVVRVLDGDTIDVLIDRKTVRVRLADIDAPERGQAFGSRARQRLADLTFRQHVEVIEQDTDRYGRILGVVFVAVRYPDNPAPQQANVNALMVREGLAWAYRYRGQPTSPQMFELEQQARRQKIGLWSDPTAQEPWKWRRATKPAIN
ncbi:thermonuclease family protein [Salmonella enterica]|nr:micrococcal nuclease [Salmonella enterica]EBR1292734.1 thermonuclease family protein [Salmonella enterica]